MPVTKKNKAATADAGYASNLVFYLNGNRVEIDNPDPETLLVDYLRSTQVGLTGTKHSCGQGGCGSCTVMLSYYDTASQEVVNVSANSCLRPIVALDGMEVTTVEGLGSVNTEISPVQYKIAKDNGSQCGYCTPGFVMNMHSLLIASEGRKITKRQIEDWFDGSICRCTGFRPILYAMKSFASDWTKADEAGTPECYVDPDEKVKHYRKPRGIDPKHLNNGPRALHYRGSGTRWFRVLSLRAAQALMAEHGVGNTLKLVVGNTSVGIPGAQPAAPTVYIDISQIDALRTLKSDSNHIIVGGAVPYNRFRLFLEELIAGGGGPKREGWEALHYMVRRTAGNIVRNVASLAGNTMLVARNAGPGDTPFPSDLFTALCALNAEVVVLAGKGQVAMPLLEFITRYNHDKVFAAQAILLQYRIPHTVSNEYIQCYKVALRQVNSHSLANTGMRVRFGQGLTVAGVSLVVGGIAQVAFHAKKTEAYLAGRQWNTETLNGALEVLHREVSAVIAGLPPWLKELPSDGISNEYRLALVEGYFYRFFLCVTEQVNPGAVPPPLRSGAYETVRPVTEGTQQIQMYKDEFPVSLPIIKLSAFEQATGQAVYTHDIPVPVKGLNAAFVTSLRANAKFGYQIPSKRGKPKKADVKKLTAWLKETYPGVVDYLTYLDIPRGGQNGTPSDYAPDPLFCEGAVTCYGQSIGLVVADTEQLANSVAAVVQQQCVWYKESKAILSIREAVEKNSIFPNYDQDDNHEIRAPGSRVNWALKTGPEGLEPGFLYNDVKLGGRRCKVVAGTQGTGGQIHFYMESQSVVAYPGEHRDITVHPSSQSPDTVQNDVATALGESANNVNVIVKRLGGGYGGKTTRTPFVASPAAIAAKKLSRTIRIAMPREVDTGMIGKRHPFLGEWNIAIVKDGPDRGKIMGTVTQFYSDGGNTLDCSFDVMDCCILGSDNAYNVPNFLSSGEVCKTNTASNNAMRSYGGVQGGLIMEEAIEAAAHSIGMRPEDVREMNLYRMGDKTPYGQTLDYCIIRQVWDRLKKTSDFDRRSAAVEEFNRNNRWKKRGISMIPLKYGLGYNLGFLMQGGAQVNVYVGDGSVLVQHGGVEMGQGIMTKIAQVAADTLNVPLAMIHMDSMETSVVPNAIGTGATSGTDLNGGAVMKACRIQRQKLESLCLSLLEQNGSEWCVQHGINYWDFGKKGWRTVVTTSVPGQKPVKGMIWNNVVSLAFQNRVDLSSQALYSTPGLADSLDQQFYGFTYSACCSEVEIDVLTGVMNVLRTDMLYDIGKSLNPAIDIGQIEGAFVMGLGYVTTEYMVFEPKGTQNPAGTLNTLNTWTYKPPAISTIPEKFNVDLFPRDTAPHVPDNPNLLMSSKGVGEPPLVLAGTVFFAIKHAILAARQDRGHDEWFYLESPATVERIWEACLVELVERG